MHSRASAAFSANRTFMPFASSESAAFSRFLAKLTDFIAFASSRSLSVFPDSGYAALRQASRPSVLLTPASVRAFLVEGFNLLQYSSIGCDSIRVALRFSLPYIVFAIRALRGRLYCCVRQFPSGALGRMCPPTL